MPFLASETYPIPHKDILSWTFDNPEYDQDMPVSTPPSLRECLLMIYDKIYVDAANPSRSISCRQAKSIIRKMVAGFHAAGLKKGDCVLLHSFNDVRFPVPRLGFILI